MQKIWTRIGIIIVLLITSISPIMINNSSSEGISTTFSNQLKFDTKITAESSSNWLIQLGTTALSFSAPVFGDIDGDGDLEAVAPVFGDPFSPEWSWAEGIYAFHHDGTVIDFDNDPNKISPLIHLTFDPGFRCQPVTLANFDGDIALEIIYKGTDETGMGVVGAYNGDGSKVNGWPYVKTDANFLRSNVASTVVADMNQDGNLEIVFADQYSDTYERTRLYVVDHMGNDLPGWPIELSRNDFGISVNQIAVANITGDENLEIVASSSPGAAQGPNTIFVFDLTGNVLWSHNFATLDFVLGDVDNDGNNEVIAVDMPKREIINPEPPLGNGGNTNQSDNLVSKLIAWDSNGIVKYEKDIIFGEYVSYEYVNKTTGLTWHVKSRAQFSLRLFSKDILLLSDLNLDGKLEVVFSSIYSLTEMVYTGGGGDPDLFNILENRGKIEVITFVNDSQLSWFPIEFNYLDPSYEYPSAVIVERLADVNGDGEVDIIAFVRNSRLEKNFLFWTSKGESLPGPTVISTTYGSMYRGTEHMTVTVGDLNQNGFVDLCVPLLGGELHMVELEAPYSNSSVAWPMYRRDLQQTGSLPEIIYYNKQPSVDNISGSVYGEVGVEYEYNFTITDPDGDDLYLWIDWGDGNTEGWLGPYNSGEVVKVNHSFDEDGIFNITAKAKDVNDAEGDWSDPLNVTVVGNLAPDIPEISGPTSGVVGVSYDFTVGTTDPDGDNVSYYIEWGDGDIEEWIGPYASGEEINASHTWDEKGTYIIRAKAKDPYDLESDWSIPLSVEIIEPEEPEPNLEISIKKGFSFGKISATVENTGDAAANDINFNISIEYGFLRKTTKDNSIDVESLAPGESQTIEIEDLRGFGFITITATITGSDVKEDVIEKTGFIIFRFIFL